MPTREELAQRRSREWSLVVSRSRTGALASLKKNNSKDRLGQVHTHRPKSVQAVVGSRGWVFCSVSLPEREGVIAADLSLSYSLRELQRDQGKARGRVGRPVRACKGSGAPWLLSGLLALPLAVPLSFLELPQTLVKNTLIVMLGGSESS